jgi:hypothetical protein
MMIGACHPVAVWPSASTCTHIWSHMHAARYIETQRGYIFDEHLVVCEYSMYCIVGARSLTPIVQSMDVAAAAHSLRTPGSAVPRPKAAARVVASARSSIPTVGLDSHRSTTVMDQDINDAHTFFSHQQSNQIMQQINQHSMCHTYMSKQANEHLSLLAMTLSMACSFRSCSRQLDLFQLFIILHNHHSSALSSAPSLTAVRTSLSSSHRRQLAWMPRTRCTRRVSVQCRFDSRYSQMKMMQMIHLRLSSQSSLPKL